MKWRYLNIAVFVANLCVLSSAFYLLYIGRNPASEDISRYEFIDLSLSILNLMVATLAILLAIAGFWGYSAIKEAAIRTAAEVADRVTREVSQEYAERGEEVADTRQIADFLKWQREQNRNKGKLSTSRKAPTRPARGEKEGDRL